MAPLADSRGRMSTRARWIHSHPTCLLLQQEAATQGAPISFVLANGEIHDWVLLTPDGFQYWPQIDPELGT